MIAEEYDSDLLKAGAGDNYTNFGQSGFFEVPWYWPIPGEYKSGTYPNGVNGANSAHHVSDTMSNYLFVDGHVKAMHPLDTNPFKVTGWDSNGNPESNMWDAIRL